MVEGPVVSVETSGWGSWSRRLDGRLDGILAAVDGPQRNRLIRGN